MEERNRRSSILKRAYVEDSSPSYTFNKISRRISFSGKTNVKEFLPADNGGTIWGTSYEEETVENVKKDPKTAAKSQPLQIRENPTSLLTTKNLTSNVSSNAFGFPHSSGMKIISTPHVSKGKVNKSKIKSPKRCKYSNIQSKVDFEKTLELSLAENELRHIKYTESVRDNDTLLITPEPSILEAGNLGSSQISLDRSKSYFHSSFSLFDIEREKLKSGRHIDFTLDDLIYRGQNSMSVTKNVFECNHNVNGLQMSSFKGDNNVNIITNTEKSTNFVGYNDENNKENVFIVDLNTENDQIKNHNFIQLNQTSKEKSSPSGVFDNSQNEMNTSESPKHWPLEYEKISETVPKSNNEIKFLLNDKTIIDQNTIRDDTLHVKRLTTHEVQDLRLCVTRTAEQEKMIAENTKRRTIYHEDDMDLTPINAQILSTEYCVDKEASVLESDGLKHNNITYNNITYNITYNPSDLNLSSVNDDTDKLINMNMNREEAVQKMSVYKSNGPTQTDSDDLDLTLQEDKPLNVEKVPSHFSSVPIFSLKEIELSTTNCFDVEKIVQAPLKEDTRKTMYHDSPIEDIESANPSISIQPKDVFIENNFKTKRQTTFKPIDLDICEPTGSVDVNRFIGISDKKNRRTIINVESELDISDVADRGLPMDVEDVDTTSTSVLPQNQCGIIGKSILENNVIRREEQPDRAPEISLEKIQSFKEAKPIIFGTANENCTNVDLSFETVPVARGLQTENEKCVNISIDFFGTNSNFKSSALKSKVANKNLQKNNALGYSNETFEKEGQNPTDSDAHEKEKYNRQIYNKPSSWNFSLNIDEENSLQMRIHARKKKNDFVPPEINNKNSEADNLDNVHSKETSKLYSSSRDVNGTNLIPMTLFSSASNQQMKNQTYIATNKGQYKMDSTPKHERFMSVTEENAKLNNHSANILHQAQNIKSKKVLFEEINDQLRNAAPLSFTQANHKLMDENMKRNRLTILEQVDVDATLDYMSVNHTGEAKYRKSSLNNMDMSLLNDSNTLFTNKENVKSNILDHKYQMKRDLNELTSRGKRETQYEANLDLDSSSKVNAKHLRSAHSEDIENANFELKNDDTMALANNLAAPKSNKRRFTIYDENDMAFEEPPLNPESIVPKSEKIYQKTAGFEEQRNPETVVEKSVLLNKRSNLEQSSDQWQTLSRSYINREEIQNQSSVNRYRNKSTVTSLSTSIGHSATVNTIPMDDIATHEPVATHENYKNIEYEQMPEKMDSKKNRATIYKVVDLEIDQENEGLRAVERDGDVDLNQATNQKRGTILLNNEKTIELNIEKDENIEYEECSKPMYPKKNRMTTYKVLDLEIDQEIEGLRSTEIDGDGNLKQANNRKRGTIFVNEEQLDESCIFVENSLQVENNRCALKNKNTLNIRNEKHSSEQDVKNTSISMIHSNDAKLSSHASDTEVLECTPLPDIGKNQLMESANTEVLSANDAKIKDVSFVDNNVCSTNKIDTKTIPEKLNNGIKELKQNTTSFKNYEFSKNGNNCKNNSDDDLNLITIDLINDSSEVCAPSAMDEKVLEPKKLESSTELNDFSKLKTFTNNLEKTSLNDIAQNSSGDAEDSSPKKVSSPYQIYETETFSSKRSSSFNATEIDLSPISYPTPPATLLLKSCTNFKQLQYCKSENNQITEVRPEEAQNASSSDLSFKEDKSKVYDGTAKIANIRSANVEINFPTSCGRNSIREALDAYKKRRESQNFDTKCEESLLLPEVPSVGFLLENYLKHESNVESEEEIGAFLPITPKFEYLLRNKIQCETLNWNFNTVYITIGFMEISHKTVSSIQFQLHFSPKYFYSNKGQIVFEKILLNTENNIENLSSVNTLIQREIQKRIPYELSKLCSTSNDLFTFLNDMDNIFKDAIRSVKELVKLIKRHWCSLKKDSSGELCIKKIVVGKTNCSNLTSGQVFMVRVRTIEKISYTDITFPPKSDLLESIQSLPEGLDFVSTFFENPQKFLKC